MCWTRSPVVMMSSAMDDSEDEDGRDDTSTHESTQ
jgi:hypothetical protein